MTWGEFKRMVDQWVAEGGRDDAIELEVLFYRHGAQLDHHINAGDRRLQVWSLPLSARADRGSNNPQLM